MLRNTLAVVVSGALLSWSLATAQEHRRGVPHAECSVADDPTGGVYTERIWPEGLVPYRFNQNVTTEKQLLARSAMDEFEAVCNVTFAPWHDQPAYLFINHDPDENSSCVGYNGGVCMVNIRDWETAGAILHQLGHSLGLYHEHQRPDRDSYVQINAANICGSTGGFVPLVGTEFGPYDFESVMHFTRRASTRDGRETIRVLPKYAEWKYLCGLGGGLSNGDRWTLTRLYGGPRPPRSFSLMSPAHRAQVGIGWTPSFEWASAEAAESYRLQVDDDPYFASPEIDELVAGTAHSAETPLADSRVYFWRVLAINPDGETEPRPRPVHVFLTDDTTPSVLYVDPSSAAGGTGASWASAMRDLNDALVLADCSAGEVAEIRVAQGVYRPDRGTGDRAATFSLTGGVQVKGGYAGSIAPDPEARDPLLYRTVLSGDLAGDDKPDFVNYEENSFHVVTALGVAPACTLEGITITAGNADGANLSTNEMGAGIYSRDSHLVLSACRVSLCSAHLSGAGVNAFDAGTMEAQDTIFEHNRTTWPTYGGGAGAGLHKFAVADLTLIGCTFRANTGFQAAGANIEGGGNVTIRDCLFEENVATQWVGAVQIYRNAAVEIDRCTFKGNVALSAQEGYAGALGIYGFTACNVRSTAVVSNCLFVGNTATWSGGGLNNDDSGSTTVVNCTFVGNTAAAGRGGGVANTSDFGGTNVLSVTNSILHGNAGGQLASIGGASTTTGRYSNVEGGWPGAGNIDADPAFVDAVGGDYRLSAGSECIDVGSNPAVPVDVLADLSGDPRFRDDPWTTEAGLPDPARPDLPIVDMGAHEFQGSSCAADFNNDAALNSQDFFDFLGDFFKNLPSADFNGSGSVNSQDFFDFLNVFFEGC